MSPFAKTDARRKMEEVVAATMSPPSTHSLANAALTAAVTTAAVVAATAERIDAADREKTCKLADETKGLGSVRSVGSVGGSGCETARIIATDAQDLADEAKHLIAGVASTVASITAASPQPSPTTTTDAVAAAPTYDPGTANVKFRGGKKRPLDTDDDDDDDAKHDVRGNDEASARVASPSPTGQAATLPPPSPPPPIATAPTPPNFFTMIRMLTFAEFTFTATDLLRYVTLGLTVLILLVYLFPPYALLALLLALTFCLLLVSVCINRIRADVGQKRVQPSKLERLRHELYSSKRNN